MEERCLEQNWLFACYKAPVLVHTKASNAHIVYAQFTPRSAFLLLKAIIHHAPLTPRSTQRTGLFKRASEHTGALSRKTEKQKSKLVAITGWVYKGEGAAAL